MQLKLPRTNVQKKLTKLRDRHSTEKDLMRIIEKIILQNDQKDQVILNEIESGHSIKVNNFNIDHLDYQRVFHLNDIYKICVDYRLRFLDSRYFKGDLPYEVLIEIKSLEKIHDTQLKAFKIVAPSKLFKLKNADDPLLFAPIGNDYYYLIHKWGNDLHPFRKMLMWPYKSLENFIVLLLAISFLCALLVPEGMFSQNQTTAQFLMIFFFIFKAIAGIAIFYGFKNGKNFNTEIWDSKLYNA
ncbi:hypothetical protein [Gramella sp. AN32]|uniref:Uncharacterized protein n=1 Tax=Christiangramia antarctica TaxID=2058158 RepID=A0ABW5X6X3_9FLAO|nr:hypothetical protein [Gramella sp. AN32]MCM4154606.1 hypothetical protein [Gramella sp. AN32]